MRVCAHVVTALVTLGVVLGIPFAAFANIDGIASVISGVDTVSSATTVQAAPSGHYTIYINREKHPSADVLADWVTFFSGQDAPLIMEDVDCVALAEDTAGIDMARSLQSRLPENQMKLRIEGSVLALSKADAGVFDVLVVSDEAAAAYGADSVASSENVEVVRR